MYLLCLFTVLTAPSESTLGFNNFWLLAGVSLLIGIIGIVAISVLKVAGDVIPQQVKNRFSFRFKKNNFRSCHKIFAPICLGS
jgi:hypothetical protein